MKIIKKNNIYRLVNKFKNKQKLVVFGKGHSFKIPIKKDLDTIFICINDSINYVENCDFLVINDLKNLKKIDINKLNNLKNLIIPYHIHIKEMKNGKIEYLGPKFNFTYEDFVDAYQTIYKNNLIVYNLHTAAINYGEFITLETTISGAHNGIEFVLEYFPNVKDIETFGIGSGYGYHNLFENTEPKSHLDTFCSRSRSRFFKNELIKLIKKYEKNIKIN